jgi:protein gp37
MAERSHIEWTDTTWNPVTGCTEVSAGCDRCYAKTFAERWRGVPGHPFERGFDLTLRPERLDQPLSWRKPRRVFVNSMSDLFHDGIPDAFITEVFARMWWTPRHTFQLLTKRHGRMRVLLPRIEAELRNRERDLALVDRPTPLTWPLPNVWLGVSVENQKWADIRIPALLNSPAAVRFLSCEPLLGPVDLQQAVVVMGDQRGHGLTASWVHVRGCCRRFHGIDWVIVGGESGPGARPMDLAWACDLAEQCQAAGVAVFVKQLGAVWARANAADPKGGNWHQWPSDLRIRQYPRPATGDAA